MPESSAEFVFLDTVIIGKLDHASASFLSGIAHKNQRIFAIRHIAPAQFLHAEQLGIKINAAFQIAHAEHGMQKAPLAHVCSPLL